MSASDNEFAKATLEQWQKAAAKSAPGGDVSALIWVTPEGIMACTCPDETGAGVVPRIARLDGPATAWTCGCTDHVGLICLPTR